MRKTLALPLFVAAIFSFSSPVLADDVGEVGSPMGLEVFTEHADSYLAAHGRLYVKNTLGTLDEYRWGGAACGTRVLTPDQLALLQSALNTKKMMIRPVSKPGQGNNLCLVGFTLVPKTGLKLVLP